MILKVRGVSFCLIGFALVGLAIGFVFYHRFNEPRAVSVPTSVEDMTKDVSLNQVQHVTIQGGVKELVLEAESAEYQRAENKTVLKDISATFFFKEGGSTHVVSRQGELMTDSQDLKLSGDVVARSGAYELQTETLFYDHKNRSIFADSRVLIKGDGMDLAGASMVFSLDTERALVKGGVEATFEDWRLF